MPETNWDEKITLTIRRGNAAAAVQALNYGNNLSAEAETAKGEIQAALHPPDLHDLARCLALAMIDLGKANTVKQGETFVYDPLYFRKALGGYVQTVGRENLPVDVAEYLRILEIPGTGP